ncbi:hypothetical protein J6590_062703 [Homalodisca vitripennis]|nr:hypothetical protein J6590_062703 [Homalodisca vitripennis]
MPHMASGEKFLESEERPGIAVALSRWGRTVRMGSVAARSGEREGKAKPGVKTRQYGNINRRAVARVAFTLQRLYFTAAGHCDACRSGTVSGVAGSMVNLCRKCYQK